MATILDQYEKEVAAIPAWPTITPSEAEIVGRFKDWWTESYNSKEMIKKQMEHAYMAYRSILSDFSYTQRDMKRWGLAVFVPLTFQVISSIEAQLNGRPPQYRVGPVNNPSDLKEAEFINKFSQAEYKRAQASREIAAATQQALTFGTSFLESYYRYDVRKKKFLKSYDEKTSISTYEEKDKTFYKGWSLRTWHPLKVYVPPVYEHDPQKWPYIIYRDLVDYRNVKTFYEAHPELRYRDNYKYIKPSGSITDDMDVYNRHDVLCRLPYYRYPGSQKDLVNSMFPTPQTSGQIQRRNLMEVFRVYSQDTDEWIVCTADRVLEYHPNPLEGSKELPVVVMRDHQIANWPWGLGEPDLIRWLQFEANAVHNLGLDAMKYSTSPIFGVNASMLEDEDEFEVYPGKIIHTRNIPGLTINSAIQTLNTPEVKGSLFKFLDLNEDIIQKTTGVGSAVIGGSSENDEGSATEFNAVKGGTEARIYEKARRIEQENVSDIIRHQLQFMAEFYDEDMTIKISDQEFYKFKPGGIGDASPEEMFAEKEQGFHGVIFGDDLAKGYDVVVEGESTLPMNRSQRRTEAMQLLKLATEARRAPTEAELAANPQLPQQYPQGLPVLDAALISKEILLPTFNVLDDPDRYLFSPEGNGPGPVRPVGRPPEMGLAPGAEPGSEPGAAPPGTDQAAMLAASQPANQDINQTQAII